MYHSKVRPEGMLLQLADGRWLVRTSHGRDAYGKRIRTSKIIDGDKREARRHLASLIKQQDEGFAPGITRQTFGEWSAVWLREWTGSLAPRTLYDYQSLLRRLFEYEREFGGLRLLALTPDHVQQVVNRLRLRGLSPRSVRMYHGVIRSCLAKAEKLGKVPRNVALPVELPSQARAERLFLQPSQAERLLREGVGDRFYTFFAILLLTGMRPGEACGLRWDDLTDCSLCVRRAVVWLPDRAPFVAETKTRRSRVIALGKLALEILKNHRAQQIEWREQMGTTYEEQGLIFANETGGLLHLRNIDTRHFKPLLERLELPRIRLYDLRHTHATLLLAAGEHPKVVQERLGHATITLTLDTYSHVVPGMQERAAERLDTLLDESRVAALARYRADDHVRGAAEVPERTAPKSQLRLLPAPRVTGRTLRAGSRSSA